MISTLKQCLAKNWRGLSLPMEAIVCLVDANASHTGVLATMFMKFAFPSELEGE